MYWAHVWMTMMLFLFAVTGRIDMITYCWIISTKLRIFFLSKFTQMDGRLRTGKVNSSGWVYMQVAQWHTQFFRLLERCDVFGCPLNLFWRFLSEVLAVSVDTGPARLVEPPACPRGSAPPGRKANARLRPLLHFQPNHSNKLLVIINGREKNSIPIPTSIC